MSETENQKKENKIYPDSKYCYTCGHLLNLREHTISLRVKCELSNIVKSDISDSKKCTEEVGKKCPYFHKVKIQYLNVHKDLYDDLSYGKPYPREQKAKYLKK